MCQSRDCDHRSYSKRYVRFVKAHQEAFDAAYLDGNGQAARGELERLEREYRTLLPRHDCTCVASHCWECGRLARQRVNQDSSTAVEIGRTAPSYRPTPMVLLLDVNAGYAR